MGLATSNVHNKLPIFKAIFLCLYATFGPLWVVLRVCICKVAWNVWTSSILWSYYCINDWSAIVFGGHEGWGSWLLCNILFKWKYSTSIAVYRWQLCASFSHGVKSLVAVLYWQNEMWQESIKVKHYMHVFNQEYSILHGKWVLQKPTRWSNIYEREN